MRKAINLIILSLLIAVCATSCKKHAESSVRLAKLATEINEASGKELNNGTINNGCQYSEGDSVFTYIIKVPDNRYDKLDNDSIKRNFSKTVGSESMAKIVNILNNSNVGLKYRLILPEKEVEIEFSRSELANLKGTKSN